VLLFDIFFLLYRKPHLSAASIASDHKRNKAMQNEIPSPMMKRNCAAENQARGIEIAICFVI
jgi:hypothetical protein